LIGLSQTSRPLARRSDVVEQWEPEAKIDYTDGDAATKYTQDGHEIGYITFEDIDAMMELESFEKNARCCKRRGVEKSPRHNMLAWRSVE
jgi:hypothetical protein